MPTCRVVVRQQEYVRRCTSETHSDGKVKLASHLLCRLSRRRNEACISRRGVFFRVGYDRVDWSRWVPVCVIIATEYANSFTASCSAVNSGSSQLKAFRRKAARARGGRSSVLLTGKTHVTVLRVTCTQVTPLPIPLARTRLRVLSGGFYRLRAALSRGARRTSYGVSRSAFRPPGSRPGTLSWWHRSPARLANSAFATAAYQGALPGIPWTPETCK